MLTLPRIYERLLKSYGPQHWWPADTPLEVCVGAILTQSTSWGNVEKAIDNLKREGLLSIEGLRKTNTKKIARLIKPSLYYNAKAEKLKAFVAHLNDNYGGNLDALLEKPVSRLRSELLGVWGIGPETADSMILYAAGKPSFVVDAYTRRVFSRLGLLDGGETYDEVKEFFETRLPKDAQLFNEYHALVVEHAKQHCKRKPACRGCPLKRECSFLM